MLFHWYLSYHWYQWRPFFSPLTPIESICEYWTTLESSHVLSPEPLRYVWIWLGFLLFRILYITGATKGYHFDFTLGFSHSSRSLRSTYLGCSFNFCLHHVTAIFGGSSAKIWCILVSGLKPAPWMFSQCCASCQIVFILICWYLQEPVDQWLWN